MQLNLSMFSLTMLAATVFAFTAQAQEVRQADLDRCAAMASAADKLRCFETLTTAGHKAEPAANENAEPAPLPPPAKAPVAVLPEAVPSDAVAIKPVPAPEPAEQAAPAPAATATSALGAEQLKRQDDDAGDQPVTATVVKVVDGPRGNLHFHLDNGQVWRQIEARRFRYPKNQEFGILISQGIMGDYRLRISPDSPATRIRRIE